MFKILIYGKNIDGKLITASRKIKNFPLESQVLNYVFRSELYY